MTKGDFPDGIIMKQTVFTIGILFLAGLFSSPAFSQTPADAVFKDILQKEQQLMDAVAVGGKAVWEKHLAEDCIIATEDGSTTTKQKMIEELSPLPKGYIGSIRVIEPKFKLYGSTAVISFINDEHLELFGQKLHTQYRQSDTWMKIKGEWKMVAMQLFEIPKNPPPVAIAESVLKQYEGTYEMSAERKCRVYVENGRLFVKKGDREPQELFAETENVFFRKGDGRVNVIFIKNAAGVYQMIERREGEDVVWKYY